MNSSIVHLSTDEHADRGRVARQAVARGTHGAWCPPVDRPNPVDLLEEQAGARIPELVPVRYGRMLVSPFTFYRGGAYIMAWDLAHTPVSGLNVQLCGDAHLSNFGGFASPERREIFDINDFDETLPGPWEWDVKRLAASFEIAGRDRGFSESERRAAVTKVVRSYRETMAAFSEMPDLDVWYAHLELEALLPEIRKSVGTKLTKKVERGLAKAHSKDSMKAFGKLTHLVDGKPMILGDPPLIVPIRDLVPEAEAEEFEKHVRQLFCEYRGTLQNDRRVLVERFEMVDLARKVVGVGSVGTRAWILLMLGRGGQDPLFFQVKEAGPSVLEGFAGASAFKNHGERVVQGQRLMQASGDIFLGWIRSTDLDGVQRDYYVRQLWDWKMSAEIETFAPKSMVVYAGMCGWTLARAHARSGDRIAIAAYLGSGRAFDEAIADFSAAYADQNQADYDTFKSAVEDGHLRAESGL